MAKYEYISKNVNGNLHDVRDLLMDSLAEEGWELVTAQWTGSATVCLFKRELTKTRKEDTPRFSS